MKPFPKELAKLVHERLQAAPVEERITQDNALMCRRLLEGQSAEQIADDLNSQDRSARAWHKKFSPADIASWAFYALRAIKEVTTKSKSFRAQYPDFRLLGVNDVAAYRKQKIKQDPSGDLYYVIEVLYELEFLLPLDLKP